MAARKRGAGFHSPGYTGLGAAAPVKQARQSSNIWFCWCSWGAVTTGRDVSHGHFCRFIVESHWLSGRIPSREGARRTNDILVVHVRSLDSRGFQRSRVEACATQTGQTPARTRRVARGAVRVPWVHRTDGSDLKDFPLDWKEIPGGPRCTRRAWRSKARVTGSLAWHAF